LPLDNGSNVVHDAEQNKIAISAIFWLCLIF